MHQSSIVAAEQSLTVSTMSEELCNVQLGDNFVFAAETVLYSLDRIAT